MKLHPAFAPMVPSDFKVREIWDPGTMVWAPATSVATMVTPSMVVGNEEVSPGAPPLSDSAVDDALASGSAAAPLLGGAPAGGGELLLLAQAPSASNAMAVAPDRAAV